MHELSIAEAIIEVASRHAGARRVAKVELKVGHLRQVVPAALEFAFELVAQGTPVEGAELAIEHLPAVGACRDCGARTELTDFPLACGECAGFEVDVLTGEELLVDSLELEEDEEALTTTGGKG